MPLRRPTMSSSYSLSKPIIRTDLQCLSQRHKYGNAGVNLVPFNEADAVSAVLPSAQRGL
jgi:hypothetical protein